MIAYTYLCRPIFFRFVGLFSLAACLGISLAQAQQTSDTSGYVPSKFPQYLPGDRYGDPFSNRTRFSPLFPAPPTQYEIEVDMENDTTLNYTILENLGPLRYRPATELSFEEFSRLQQQRSLRNYWKQQSAGLDGESPVSGRNLIPPIYTSPIFDRIFGGSYINIQPNGFVNLDFGGLFERVENPALPLRSQRNNQFNFDQQINMNVTGKLGEKLEVNANFDSNNSFDFENNFRVEYTGFEEEIIKKIEIGNVSLPVRNSLMSGAQSLFGVKTQLQFGKLYVTGVASTQRGESDAIEIEGGSQASTFSFRASDYDDNRHFFLGHFFHDQYGIEAGQWLANLPQLTSGINITRLEVYVVNRNNSTETLRNVAAFMDLAEGQADDVFLDNNPQITPLTNQAPTGNQANSLYDNLLQNPSLRNIDQVDQVLEGQYGFENSRDYVVLKSARKLSENEYAYHAQLGYLTLSRRLQNDEALAVAYEYTYNGKRYQVGELTENYQNRPASDVIFMKMLRPNKINTRVPSWELMMKNVYALNANQVTREGFDLKVIYRDDASGLDVPNLQEGANTRNIPLVRVLGLDRLNQSNDPQHDGNFDFIEGVTINLDRGLIIFPVPEPFGDYLEEQFLPNEQALINKYVFDTLYNTTKNDAQQVAAKDKFFIEGSFSASSSTEIALPGINISPGSVRVFAGNTPLTEGLDYQVDYQFGRVRLLNEGIVNSGKKIRITFEKASLLNFQTRRFLGAHFDYLFNEHFTAGATVLYLNELRNLTRVGIGEEPTKNLKWGFDLNYQNDSRLLTRLVDKLPLLQTKELSSVTFNSEFAQMLPGTSNQIDGEGTAYIEDFETAVTPYSLGNSPLSWSLAATPMTANNRFSPTGNTPNQLEFGYKRAKLAWYTVDNIFYVENDRSRYAPSLSKEDLKNNYFRAVSQQEIFKRDLRNFNPNEPILDLVYFPEERGPYNYNPELNNQGRLPNPEQNWGGITQAIRFDVDFDRTNIEYLEFWMLDPFIAGENGRNAAFEDYSITNEGSGGKLVFNLGSVSEDYVNDNRHGFENGLPPNGGTEQVELTPWGKVTQRQFLNNAFDISGDARQNQDVGQDGLPNAQEAQTFADYVSAHPFVADDPSADNFRFYLGEEYDNENANLISRYKNFNNHEGNTPLNTETEGGYTTTGNPRPENEDLNEDNTLNDLEEYYSYEIELRPDQMEVGRNYIAEKITTSNQTNGEEVNWYLFRIPIREYTEKYGDIQGFKSIRYLRTYLTGFQDPIALRFAKMQLVGSQWRRYLEDLEEEGLGLVDESDATSFTISSVGYEDNSNATGEEIPYVLPPGFERDYDNTSINQGVRNNEQSLQLCVSDLEDKDARAVFKTVSLDLVNYGRLKMLFHAESLNDPMLQDGDLTAFLRLGTDYSNNYYEIEIPLKITPAGSRAPNIIWPDENEIDLALQELYTLKARRNSLNRPLDQRFAGTAGKHTIYVKGNPDLSAVMTLMTGIRNPGTPEDRSSHSACVWANELRVTDFDRKAGWAANARLNTKLADFANLTGSVRYTTVGFGDIGQRVSQRTRDEAVSYDVSGNFALHKLLSERSRLRLPLFLAYEQAVRTPFYDPANPDLPLSASLNAFGDERAREGYQSIVEDRSTRRSLNLTNVRWERNPERERPPMFFDKENFAFTYAYSDVRNTSWETAEYLLQTYKGAIAYNFTPEEKYIEPFANIEGLKSNWLKLIKDFNFSLRPSVVSMRWDLDRRFMRTQLRSSDLTTDNIQPQFEKLFTMNRLYSLRWNLSRNLALDYNARANAIIDEPAGDINTEFARDSVMENLLNLGRMKNFDQNIAATYRLPFDKLPLTNWISADARYEANYTWTAGSIDQVEEFGNQIQNRRTGTLTGKLDLVRLYNSSAYLKKVNDAAQRRGMPQRPRPGQRPGRTQQQTKEGEGEEKKESKFGQSVVRLLLAVRGINFNYSQSEGTMLPGFRPRAFLFGMDSSFMAPGLPFLLGSQDPDIRYEARNNDWLSRSSQQTAPFMQTAETNYDLRFDVQPINDFRIQVDLKKNVMAGYQEIYRYDADSGRFISLTPTRTGSYSLSFLSIATAFDKELADNGSEAFEQFARNRDIIKSRLRDIEARNGGVFNENGQDVLIPAFLAAYSGKDAEDVKLSPFPNFPLPNWRVDYAGLSRIPAIRDIFSSFTLSHSYTSRYSVSSFNNHLDYQNPDLLSLNNDIDEYSPALSTLQTDSGSLVPFYIIQGQVIISEQFSPLIGINLRTKSRLTTQISYNRERNLALQLANIQVTEQRSQDLRLDLGYTTNKFKLPFKVRGREKTLTNDITFRLGLTIRDTETFQRKLDEPDDLVQGNYSFQINPTINYTVNQQLSLQFYVDSRINEPKVSSSFRTTNTRFGTQLRFNITQ